MLNNVGYGLALARLTYSLSLLVLPYIYIECTMIRVRATNKNYVFVLACSYNNYTNSSEPGQNYGIMIQHISVFLFLRLSNICFKQEKPDFIVQLLLIVSLPMTIQTWFIYRNTETVEQIFIVNYNSIPIVSPFADCWI